MFVREQPVSLAQTKGGNRGNQLVWLSSVKARSCVSINQLSARDLTYCHPSKGIQGSNYPLDFLFHFIL